MGVMMRRIYRLIGMVLAAHGLVAQAASSHPNLIPPRPVYADSLPDARLAPIRFTVADAEAEGARWPRRSEPSTQPPSGGVEQWTDATPARCSVGGTAMLIGSGDFRIGGNVNGAESGHQVKIWWEPKHPAESFSLVVRGARLGPVPDTLRYLQSGWAIGGSPRTGATGPDFYPSGIAFPSPGRWLLIATSGADWGCFVLTAY